MHGFVDADDSGNVNSTLIIIQASVKFGDNWMK